MLEATIILLRTLAVTLGAAAAAWLGCWLAQRPGKAWFWAWAIPLLLVYAVALGLNVPRWSFAPPLSWILGGWSRWMVVAAAASMALGALITRLPKTAPRRALWMLWAVVVFRTALLPFLSPLFSNGELRRLKTHVDAQGVCLQGTNYNCGPASAVTALRKLGFPAEEGQLGLLCDTTNITGTADDLLAAGLERQYGAQGLLVERRYLDSIDDLRAWPVSIAVIKYGFFVDHYVTILGFKGSKIIVGDPLCGEDILPVEEFVKSWRHVAILLRRKGS